MSPAFSISRNFNGNIGFGIFGEAILKIVFVIKALGSEGGGAERVMVEVASGLAQRGHQVSVVTSDRAGMPSYYSLHPAVHQVNLGIGDVSSRTNLLDAVKRMFAIRRVVAGLQPDVVVGFMSSTYMLLVFALCGLGVRLVASEHMGGEYYATRPLQRFLLNLMPFTTTKIAVVTEQVKENFPPRLRRLMLVIPNPVSFELGSRADLRGNVRSSKILLTVGRFDLQKDHACLIAAFASIAKAVPDWNLRIVGNGILKRELESQIEALHLEDRIQLCGTTKDVVAEYLDAQLFVCPSLYESFGLVVAEALVHGLPVVGFADCPGSNQLIKHNQNGLLVDGTDRVKSLATALQSLMLNPDERCRLGSASADWLVAEYDIKTILDKWERLLLELT